MTLEHDRTGKRLREMVAEVGLWLPLEDYLKFNKVFRVLGRSTHYVYQEAVTRGVKLLSLGMVNNSLRSGESNLEVRIVARKRPDCLLVRHPAADLLPGLFEPLTKQPSVGVRMDLSEGVMREIEELYADFETDLWRQATPEWEEYLPLYPVVMGARLMTRIVGLCEENGFNLVQPYECSWTGKSGAVGLISGLADEFSLFDVVNDFFGNVLRMAGVGPVVKA